MPPAVGWRAQLTHEPSRLGAAWRAVGCSGRPAAPWLAAAEPAELRAASRGSPGRPLPIGARLLVGDAAAACLRAFTIFATEGVRVHTRNTVTARFSQSTGTPALCLRSVSPLSVSATCLRDVSPRRVSATCLRSVSRRSWSWHAGRTEGRTATSSACSDPSRSTTGHPAR